MKNKILKSILLLSLLSASIIGVIQYKYPRKPLTFNITLLLKSNGNCTINYGSKLVEYVNGNAIKHHLYKADTLQTLSITLPQTIEGTKLKMEFDQTIDSVWVTAISFQKSETEILFFNAKNLINTLSSYENKTQVTSFKNGVLLLGKGNKIAVEIASLDSVLQQLYYSNQYYTLRILSVVFFILSLVLLLYVALFDIFGITKKAFVMQKIYVLVFGVLLLIPFIFSIIAKQNNNANKENRNKNQFPTFTIAHFSKFLPGIIAYVDDNFGGRETLIELNTTLKTNIFEAKVIGDKVISGKDNWLFYNAKFIKSYNVNSTPFTEAELKEFALNQLYLQAWLKLQHIDYYFFLPPSAMTIYPEMLPSWYKKCHKFTKREQIINYLKQHTNIPIIVPDHYLKSKKNKHQLYYKSDSHWNYFGAYYAFEYLIQQLKTKYPGIPHTRPLESNVLSPKDFNTGDLLKMAGITGEFCETDTIVSPTHPDFKYYDEKTAQFIPINHDKTAHDPSINYVLITQHNALKNAPQLVMYRDSYAGALLMHMANHFKSAYFVWDAVINPQLKPKKGTDIFIYEVVEHQLNSLKPIAKEIKAEVDKNGIKINIH
jgi:alginate O-acetyltransferase complex protein AlgJ